MSYQLGVPTGVAAAAVAADGAVGVAAARAVTALSFRRSGKVRRRSSPLKRTSTASSAASSRSASRPPASSNPRSVSGAAAAVEEVEPLDSTSTVRALSSASHTRLS